MNQIRKGRLTMLAVDGGVLLLGLLAKFLATFMIDWLPDCIYGRWGVTCPACGATRCVREFSSGRFAVAFRLHPFFFCLIFYLAAAMLLLNLGFLLPQQHCQKLGKAMVGPRAIIILAVIYAVFGLSRMFWLMFL